MAGLRTMIGDACRAFRSVQKKAKEKKLTREALTGFRVMWHRSSPLSEKICYYSTYDPESIVDEYVFFYLEQLRRQGFSLVLVTTSSKVSEMDFEHLKAIVDCVIHRDNLGLDFFSWKIGMAVCPPPGVTRAVLFANDSVYGPILPLDGFLEKMEKSSCDMVGFTDSWFYSYHVHSYFLYCKASLVDSGFLNRFFSQVAVKTEKTELIKLYEVGLSTALIAEGYKVGALVEYSRLAEGFRKAVPQSEIDAYGGNSMYLFWSEQLKSSLNPFLKKGVISVLGPNHVVLSRLLEDVIATCNSDFAPELVLDHIARSRRN